MFRVMVLVAATVILAGPTGDVHAEDSADRPRIGLALSGGGARGGAHIGVLRKLEELQIPVDYIAGTSMGAIVGALYASGYSPDEIESLMLEADWQTALSDQPHRRDSTMRKKDLERQFLIPYRVGYNNGSVQFPMGAVEGQHLDQMFNRFLMHVSEAADFSNLRIPFRAVATDLQTGEEVVISEGDLANAIRASMSIPAYFVPVPWEGRLLVDGGMANNLPISVAREMGADIVIAVDVGSPLLSEEELDSVLSVTEQLTNFLTRKNTEAQIATLGERDILLVPDLTGVSSADFKNAAPAAQLGYEVADANHQALAALSHPGVGPQLQTIDIPEVDDRLVIHSISLNNESVLDDEIILSRIDAKLGEPLDLDLLERNIDQVYALDVFQSVTYNIITDPAGQRGLHIEALPRAWGPNYFQLGLELTDDFSGSSDFKVSAAYTRNALNPYGGEMRAYGAFGREDELSFNFYQPVDKAANWYAEAEIYYQRDRFDIYFENELISELIIGGTGASFGFGRNFNSSNRLSLSYDYFRGDADERIGPVDFLIDDNVRVGELVLRYEHDSLDDLYFPSEGSAALLSYSYASDALQAGTEYEQAYFQGTQAWTFGRNNITARAQFGYSFDDAAPIERWFQIGGFGRLSGLVPNQHIGRNLGLVSLTYMRKLLELDLAPVYAGISAEAGNVWQFTDDVSFSDMDKAGSLFLGVRTPIGPIYLGYGYHESGDTAVYFYLGNPFELDRY